MTDSDRILLDCMTCHKRFHIRRAVASMVTVCPKCKHFVVPWEREVRPVEWIGPGAPKERQPWRGTIPKPPPPPTEKPAQSVAGAPPGTPPPILAELVSEPRARAIPELDGFPDVVLPISEQALFDMLTERGPLRLPNGVELPALPQGGAYDWESAGGRIAGIAISFGLASALLGPCGMALYVLGMGCYACHILIRIASHRRLLTQAVKDRSWAIVEYYAALPEGGGEPGEDVDFIP